ncbi:MAG: hypothetical protein K9H26_00045 [Prolixibacteraceae bacterium]|nr:hypothetical protein [Prolixibacteraceae bacterium]
MKNYSFIFGMLCLLVVANACEKDDSDPKSIETNTIALNGESFNVNTGYIINTGDDNTVNSWEIAIRGHYESEKSAKTDTGIVAISNTNFTINFELVSLNSSSIEGTYSLGDLNGDGITNELDATGAGYCTTATIDMKETTYFYSGELTLKEINTETANFNITFSFSDGVDQTLSGNADLTYNNN